MFRKLLGAVVILGLSAFVLLMVRRGDDNDDSGVDSAVDSLDTAALSWQSIATKGPSIRWGNAAVADEKRDRLLSFGGFGSAIFNDLWAMSLADRSWTKLDTSGSPSPRWMPTMIIDEARDRLIVFGGNDGKGALGDIYALDLGNSTWSQLPGGPRARYDHMVDVDQKRGRMYVFGGFTDDGLAKNDLWAFDLRKDEWQAIRTTGAAPAPRTNAAFALTDDGARLLVTGGHDENAVNPDSWLFAIDDERWSLLQEDGSPTARAHMALSYDQMCGRLWMFGGDNKNEVDLATTYSVRRRGSELTIVARSDGGPPARRHAAMVLDRTRRQLLLVHGMQGTAGVLFDDVWMLQLPQSC